VAKAKKPSKCRVARTTYWSAARSPTRGELLGLSTAVASMAMANPDERTTALILKMHDDGRKHGEISKATGLKPDTIRKLLTKKGRGTTKGRETPRETQEKILALSAEGMSNREIARIVGITHVGVAKIIKRAGPLKVPMEERITRRIEQQEIQPETVEEVKKVVVEAAKDSAEFTWAIAATKMLLTPGMDAPYDQRVKRLHQELTRGERELTRTRRLPVLDGRNLVKELNDVASFAMQMMRGAEPKEYIGHYRKGGVKAMMKYGEKVAADQAPIEAEQIADFVTLATMQAALPTGTSRTVSEAALAEEITRVKDAAGASSKSHSDAAVTAELKLVEHLKNLLRSDPDAFMAKVMELREEMRKEGREPGKMTSWSEQRLRTALWELLGTEASRQAMDSALLADLLAHDVHDFWSELRFRQQRIDKRQGRAAALAQARFNDAVFAALGTDKERDAVFTAIAAGETEPPRILRTRKYTRKRRGMPQEIRYAIEARKGGPMDPELAEYRRTRKMVRTLATAEGMEPTEELMAETLKLMGVTEPIRGPKEKLVKPGRRLLPRGKFPAMAPPSTFAPVAPPPPAFGYAKRPKLKKPRKHTPLGKGEFQEMMRIMARRPPVPPEPKGRDVLSERARAKREHRDFRIVEAVLGGYTLSEAASMEGVSDRIAESALRSFEWTLLDALDATGATKITKKVVDMVADAIGVPISAAQIKAIATRWEGKPRWQESPRSPTEPPPVMGFGGIELAGEAEREAIARREGWLKNPSAWGTRLFARVNMALATGGGFVSRKRRSSKSARRDDRRAGERRRLSRMMRA